MTPDIQYLNISSLLMTVGCIILTAAILSWLFKKSKGAQYGYPQEAEDTVQRYASPTLSKRQEYSSLKNAYDVKVSTYSTPIMNKTILNPSDVSLDRILSPGTHRRNLDTRVAKLLNRCDKVINTNNVAAKNTQNLLSNL